ncbi:MAG TPA: hypothetical protein VNT20_08495 [Flavisolibacter sp.]|jgi:hypothetical protein|nr:hypothetical protein [Flavisolibacter sp.]
MQKELRSTPLRNIVLFIAVLINAIILKIGFTNNDKWYWALFITLPVLLISIGITKPDKKRFKQASFFKRNAASKL